MQWIELAQYKSKLQDFDYMMMNRLNIQDFLGQPNNNYLLRNFLYRAVGWIKNEFTHVLYTSVVLVKFIFAQLYKILLATYGIDFHYRAYKSLPLNKQSEPAECSGGTQ
jgi:hypothetical protein